MQIASHYGIKHYVRRVSREEFLGDIPSILDSMDQPSIDGVNTWYASKALYELGLKVAISGVGGDELFQGYSHFRSITSLVSLLRTSSNVPGVDSTTLALGRVLSKKSGNPRWRYLNSWGRTVEGAWFLKRSIHTPDSLSEFLGRDVAEAFLEGFDVVEYVRRITGPLSADPFLAIGQIESMSYLRNQLLRDSDWASMAHSLELRTPLVDVQLLSTLSPVFHDFKKFPKKSLLADSPNRSLPRSIRKRGKTGFEVPLNNWAQDRVTQGNDCLGVWMNVVSHDIQSEGITL
jgi:asparagine synthase (glutamine-hydrolysing)